MPRHTTSTASLTSIAATGWKAAPRSASTPTAGSRSSIGRNSSLSSRRRLRLSKPRRRETARQELLERRARAGARNTTHANGKGRRMQHYSTADLERQVVEKAYARWVLVYDTVCGPFFERGRHTAAQAARRVGGRILESGVGPGLSFDDYGAGPRIVGVDISEPMIEKAKRRLATRRYPHVEDVRVMDAHALDFADASFDCAVAQ